MKRTQPRCRNLDHTHESADHPEAQSLDRDSTVSGLKLILLRRVCVKLQVRQWRGGSRVRPS